MLRTAKLIATFVAYFLFLFALATANTINSTLYAVTKYFRKHLNNQLNQP